MERMQIFILAKGLQIEGAVWCTFFVKSFVRFDFAYLAFRRFVIPRLSYLKAVTSLLYQDVHAFPACGSKLISCYTDVISNENSNMKNSPSFSR